MSVCILMIFERTRHMARAERGHFMSNQQPGDTWWFVGELNTFLVKGVDYRISISCNNSEKDILRFAFARISTRSTRLYRSYCMNIKLFLTGLNRFRVDMCLNFFKVNAQTHIIFKCSVNWQAVMFIIYIIIVNDK